jgi:hypothetical protein
MRRARHRWFVQGGWWLWLAVALAAWIGESPQLVVENGTALDVTLLIDGERVAGVAAGDGVEINGGDSGPLPWR